MFFSVYSTLLRVEYRSLLLKLFLFLVIFEFLLCLLTASSAVPSLLALLVSYDQRQRRHASDNVSSSWGDPRLVQKWRLLLPLSAPAAATARTETGTSKYETLQQCPAKPPDLLGPLQIHIPRILSATPSVYSNDHVVVGDASVFEWPQLTDRLHEDLNAGHYRPPMCRARQKVAIIVPYRNRSEHLRVFLNHMVPILKRQQRGFKIYVVEQEGRSKFNRGLLMNVGYVEALREYSWQCVVFHDVDLLPENDRHLYQCDKKNPIHLSGAIDKFNYSQPYREYFGGVEAFPVNTFRNINGFSNLYWGWGGEDDDLFKRLKQHGYIGIQPSSGIARYKMIKHVQNEQVASNRWKILEKSIYLMKYDGLSSLKYRLKKTIKMPLFTHLRVEARPEDYSKKFIQLKLGQWLT